jgi:hypothetical protein
MHHRSLSLPKKFGAHKNMVKDMGRTTAKSNVMNDKGIPSTPTASDLMDITASQVSLSLTVANERDTANSPAPFNRPDQKIIVQIHLNLRSLRGIDNPQSTKVLVKLPLRKTKL